MCDGEIEREDGKGRGGGKGERHFVDYYYLGILTMLMGGNMPQIPTTAFLYCFPYLFIFS